MRGEFESLNAGKEDGRRQFGVKLLGAVISVALLVAVAVVGGGSEKEVATRDLIVGSDDIVNMAQKIEQDVLKSTGLRVKVVQPEDLAALALSAEKSDLVGSDATYGTFGIKFSKSNRYLSSHDGVDKKLVTENSVVGNDDKWQLTPVGSSGRYKVQSLSNTNNCAAIEGDGDVRLDDSCTSDKTKLVLLRIDTNTAPSSNYNANEYLLYGYESSGKFIKCSSSGSISSGQNPEDAGYFSFVSA